MIFYDSTLLLLWQFASDTTITDKGLGILSSKNKNYFKNKNKNNFILHRI